MGVEIERKFLLLNDAWRTGADSGTIMRQGYFATVPGVTVRVRMCEDAVTGCGSAFLTVKGTAIDLCRSEFEYAIPVADAKAMLKQFCSGRTVSKVRYRVKQDNHCWEIDVFEGKNTGLTVAEIELSDPAEEFARPEWLGREVSDDHAYANSSLAINPYSAWRK